ncbi:MAG TPA: hypothetical protein VL947_14155 [Cytophagales bacterium]|nr:hypothetical protein [Cytophagales bacterium]
MKVSTLLKGVMIVPIKSPKWSFVFNLIFPLGIIFGLYCIDFIYFRKVNELGQLNFYCNYSGHIPPHITQEVQQRLLMHNIVVNNNISLFFTSSEQEFNVFTYFMLRGTLAGTYGITNKIFINQAALESNVMDLRFEEFPRKLSDVIVHEVTHIYMNQKEGYFSHTYFLESWKKEGFCDYVAGTSRLKHDRGMNYFLNDSLHEELQDKNDKLSERYFYFSSRLYMDYLLRQKKNTLNEIIKSDINLKLLRLDIKDQILRGSYKPFLK